MIYVVQTKPKQEDYLLRQLEYTGISAYCPSERMIIRSKGGWHENEKKIFSGYIFIDSDYSAELHQKIRQLDGYLRFLGEPSPLSSAEAEQIKYLFNRGKPIGVSKYEKNYNGTITFTSGVLTSLNHKIIKMYPRQKRAKVSVSINGKEFKVFLPIEKI